LRDAYCQNDQSNANAMRLVRYPNGLALIGPHEPQQKQRRELPRAGFDDDFDEHNMDADRCLPLADHLADVAEETRRLATALSLDTKLADALVAAAERHDLGKADPRFQAMLRKSMPFVTQSQPKLWAKSNLGVSARHTAGEPDSYSLPTGFRHEMLSVQFAQRIEDNLNDEQRLVVLHTIAAHHGHARPFAPVVEDDQAAEYPVSLEKLFPGGDKIVLSGEDRILTPPAHRLDSGIASRFWQVTRRYGWWGAAWLETALRLSDWTASAQPRTDRPFVPFKPHVQGTPAGPSPFELPCPGIDGSNPLGFLAALGLLRTLDAVLGQSVKLKWQTQSGWIPVFELDSQLTESEVAQLLHAELHNRQDAPHFNDLGKNTTVPQSEFRQVLASALKDASADNRTTVDFYAAFGSDGLVSENDGQTIQDTALRTMAGAGHQHFLETMSNVIATCEPEHLQKTLFDLWTYDDPTQTLSLRFDPLDDNRYALQWRNPSGDPDRKKRGSMLGANRLAIEAIPFFTTAPGTRHLQTTGFRGHRSSDTFFSWPIWTVPLTSRVIQSLLASTELATQATLFERGVACVFRSQRITVGKVRNFTPATMLSRPATATVRG
jgi:CRISPR-associated endonuclease/helicase Cas3